MLGLNSSRKSSKVFSHLMRLGTNIAFLQETHLLNSDYLRLQKQQVEHIFRFKFNAKTRGLAIKKHKKSVFCFQFFTTDPHGHYILVSGKLFRL